MERRQSGSATQANKASAIPGTSENARTTIKRDAFHVDTGVIPQAQLGDQGATELENLGLSVFNQDVFEQGIMDQVDNALAKEEESRLRKILERELTSIGDDIGMAKKDLDRVNKAEADLEASGSTNRETARQIESMNAQKQNKIKQIKTLKVRRENVLKKLKGFDQARSGTNDTETEGDVFNEAFDISGKPKQETNQERMIRTGEMTPFGTVVKAANSKPKPAKAVRMSQFENQMMARESPAQKVKKDFSKYLKKKREAVKTKPRDKDEDNPETSGASVFVLTEKKRNRFDERDWKVYDKDPWERPKRQTGHRINHNFQGDSQLSDEEGWNRECDEAMDCDDPEDEYQPSKEDFLVESTDEENDVSDDDGDLGKIKRGFSGHSTNRKRHKLGKRPRKPPKYRGNSDDEDCQSRIRVKRDMSIRRERDDADPEDYQDRLIKQQKLDAQEEKEVKAKGLESDEEDEEDTGEFDGGLKVPHKLWKKLYKYQKTGVRWLWELHTQQAGGIVGDEMGLGKTIQTIAFLAALRTSKVRNVNFPYKGLGPTIIVCPTTVMHQWLKECHKWWPDFRVAVLHSSSSFTGSQSELVRSIAKSMGILITSYSTLVIQQELILRFNWHYVVLDEGHKIRNPDAKVTLCCKQFRTPHRIVLSGSPIQNNLKELWSLFDFVFPGKLGTLPDFMQHFSIPIVQGGYSNATQVQVETAYRCACVLRDTINPYLIRRMKADVKQSINLPGKNEQVLFCRLTEEQKQVYQEYLGSRECNAILQGKFQIFAGLIMLRKICNHPDLSTGGLQLFTRGPSDEPEDQFGHFSRSGKMIVVEALLRLWKKQGHRCLLFTQSKSMLNILEQFVQDQGHRYLSMDGGTSISARQPLINQYNQDPSIFLFLLTTRVGGLGVNLTGADRVIIFDPDWNPSTDMQARERAWRIGQQRQVTIYRLLTSGTIEEKIYHRQIFKQFLTNRILKDPKQRRLFKSQDMYELFTLGSQDNREGTETSALFAGTGSNVSIPKKCKRNRFDELEEKRKKEREMEEENEDEVEYGIAQTGEKAEDERRGVFDEKADGDIEDEESVGLESSLDSSEIERMREFARMLSRKMEMEKQMKQKEEEKATCADSNYATNEVSSMTIDSSEVGDEGATSQNKEDGLTREESRSNSCEERTETSQLELESERVSCPTIKMEKTFDDQTDSTIVLEEGEVQVKEEPDTETHSEQSQDKKVSEQKGCSWEKNGAKWTIPKNKNRVEESTVKDVRESLSYGKRKEREKSSRLSDDGDKRSRESDRRRHKKKKRHHDARFEGEKIPNLVKHCSLNNSGGQEEKSTDSRGKSHTTDDSRHDDYVLRELFKKTGIQGAMKHDKIMESARPDFAIVEAEAAKVAKEAAEAMKRSRRSCSSALSGQPTWTGQHGVKPRFGQKKNSLLVGKSGKQESSTSNHSTASNQTKPGAKNPSEKREERLFDGSVSGNMSLSSKQNSLTSNDLLTRMQARKRISGAEVPDEEEDEFLRPDRHAPPIVTIDPKDDELIKEIRDYVAFMASRDGEATSQEIVLNFGPRLPPAEAPKFKAMLEQICELQTGGVWRLKAEYR